MRPALILISLLTVTGTAWAEELTGTLAKIRDSGTMTIGFRDDSPPFSYVDGNGDPAGYSIDLCLRIAAAVKKKLGTSELDVVWRPVTAESRLDAVVNGEVDIECGSTTNTLSRQKRVDFTFITFVTGGSLLVSKRSGVATSTDLRGKTVAVVSGTTTEAALHSFLSDKLIVAKVRTVASHEQGMKQLESGEVDAFASDRVVLIGLGVTAKDPDKLVLLEDFFSYEPYAFVVRRNDSDFRLVANSALAEVYRSGRIASIYDQWFGGMGAPSRLLLSAYRLQGLPE